jgi:branched-chain amino acid transport system ATP-binding protein
MTTARERPLALGVEGVDMRFHGLQVLDTIEVELPAGSSTALIGPNGSGKTTLLNVISGIYKPSRGTVRVGERAVTGLGAHRIAQLGVGRTFQHIEMSKSISALRVVMQGRHVTRRTGLLSYALGLPYLRGIEREHAVMAMMSLRLVGADHIAHRALGELPYGLAKRVDLARALAAGPHTLLLDEPAAGLNDQERRELARLLCQIRKEQNLTMVVVEHDMSFVTSVCEDVIVLSSGRKVYDGPLSDLYRSEEAVRTLTGASVNAENRAPEIS